MAPTENNASRLQPDPRSSAGSCPGAVTATVVNPSGTAGSPHTIDLALGVVDRPVVYRFLPIVTR